MYRLSYIPILFVVGLMFWIVSRTAFPVVETEWDADRAVYASEQLRETAEALNEHYERLWKQEDLMPAKTADDLIVYRRLSLALHGTVPSLEEIRRFAADTRPEKLSHWCREMLADARFANYFAERLARTFVGTQGEPFLVFRRDRFKNWLAEQLAANRHYDEVVRDIIAQQGLWTGKPATNFITHAVMDEEVNENKLAGRTVRAVLGQRMDCAQCHDHPFADWKQKDFEGLAAFYGQAKLSVFGIEDDATLKYAIEDPESEDDRVVEPVVPFGEEWLPEHGRERERLAIWATSAENRRFARATVNRIWALMFGKAWSEGAPYWTAVDDLPDPDPTGPDGTALDLLAEDFIQHDYDLQRLVQIIAMSHPFRLSSASDVAESEIQAHLDHWAVFPLVRLRPEQVVGSILQATSIKTIDIDSHLLTRTFRLIRENDFISEYGDFGDEELEMRSGTVPQALLRMNGNLIKETTEPNPFSATPRVAFASGSPEVRVENCFLMVLTRPPLKAERAYFLQEWQADEQIRPAQQVQDLTWTLMNSPEFSWNH